MANKQTLGQYYTSRAMYILDGIQPPAANIRVVEPFAGQGDLLNWLNDKGFAGFVEAYDIDPKHPNVSQRDTLTNPPDYRRAWVLTNPPYMTRNKSAPADKALFDLYDTNDLFKCFIHSLCDPKKEPALGGALIIPATFFLAVRQLDIRCRHEFLTRYRVLRVNYFEEQVFDDASVTVVAVWFERYFTVPNWRISTQPVPWYRYPDAERKEFMMDRGHDWMIGGEVNQMAKTVSTVLVRREVTGNPLRPGEVLSKICLRAIDSGSPETKIALCYDKSYVSKHSSRSYAVLTFTNLVLTPEQQQWLCTRFNEFLGEKRKEMWSLFLQPFHETKGNSARKRISFDLAYGIIRHLLEHELPTARSVIKTH